MSSVRAQLSSRRVNARPSAAPRCPWLIEARGPACLALLVLALVGMHRLAASDPNGGGAGRGTAGGSGVNVISPALANQLAPGTEYFAPAPKYVGPAHGQRDAEMC